MTLSTIFIVALIVAVIYNAEKLPQMMNKLKDEVPHIVEAGKKASKELKEKAQTVKTKTASKKNAETEDKNEE